MLSFILTILGKTLIVEIIIELLRQALHAVRFNEWAGGMLIGTNKNPQFDFYLSVLESLLVISLLIFGFSMLFTTIAVFIFMLASKEFAIRAIYQ